MLNMETNFYRKIKQGAKLKSKQGGSDQANTGAGGLNIANLIMVN